MPNETNEKAYRDHVDHMARDYRERSVEVEERAIKLAPKAEAIGSAMLYFAKTLKAGGDMDSYHKLQKHILTDPALEDLWDYLQDEFFYEMFKEG